MSEFYSGYIAGIAQVIIGYPLDTAIIYKQTGQNIKNIKLKYIYKGIQYPLFTSGIISSLCFGINYNIYIYTNNYYISGAITGIFTSVIISPTELYKIRSQKLKSGTVHIFTGLRITVAREIIASSTYFGIYNTLKDNNVNGLLSGGITGCISWIASYPLDLIKTRIQSGEYKTIKQNIQIKNLYNGLSICLCRSFLVNSVGFYTYEKCIKYFTTSLI